MFISWIWSSIRHYGWAPLGFFGVHVVLSQGFDAYLHYAWLDQPMHFFGGVAIAYFIARSLTDDEAQKNLGSLTARGQLMLALTSLFATTVLWEFAEWSTDHLGWTHAQVGLDDTLLDMLLGISGGACYFLLRPFSSGSDR